MALTQHEIDRRFKHHPPRDERDIGKHQTIRAEFAFLAQVLSEELPPDSVTGRENALANTALEQASFWAHAALARARSDA